MTIEDITWLFCRRGHRWVWIWTHDFGGHSECARCGHVKQGLSSQAGDKT